MTGTDAGNRRANDCVSCQKAEKRPQSDVGRMELRGEGGRVVL